MPISGLCIHSSDIQLQFLDSLLFFTDVCNVLPVVTFVGFRHADPDDATMEDAKKALSRINIEFKQMEDWNADRCLDSLWG